MAAVRYECHGKLRKGVASTFLVDEAPEGSQVLVYVHKNKNFRIPEDDATPIINKLPNHPLETERYVTMGDWHSTRKPKIRGGAESTSVDSTKHLERMIFKLIPT